MLNEKKFINDKLLQATLLAIMGGILVGSGLCLCAAAFVTKAFGSGVIGGLMIVGGSILCHLGDKSRNIVRDYINQPYVTFDKENEDVGTNMDSPTD